MSYIEMSLQPGERVVCVARVHWLAYVFPLILMAGMMMFKGLTGLASTNLALTDKRLIGKVGAFNRKHLDLPHAAIESVRVRQGLFGMLFDYGDIIVTGNGTKLRFRGIREPFDLQMHIDEAIEMAVLGRTLSKVVMEKF